MKIPLMFREALDVKTGQFFTVLGDFGRAYTALNSPLFVRKACIAQALNVVFSGPVIQPGFHRSDWPRTQKGASSFRGGSGDTCRFDFPVCPRSASSFKWF